MVQSRNSSCSDSNSESGLMLSADLRNRTTRDVHCSSSVNNSFSLSAVLMKKKRPLLWLMPRLLDWLVYRYTGGGREDCL